MEIREPISSKQGNSEAYYRRMKAHRGELGQPNESQHGTKTLRQTLCRKDYIFNGQRLDFKRVS